MPKSNRSILYVSDSEESEYELENQDASHESDSQVFYSQSESPSEPAPEPDAKPARKIEGVRARDLKRTKRKQSFQCQYCGRPFVVSSYHQKHEEKCPVRLKRDAEWARELAKTQKETVEKTKRKQAYQAKKAILEASRPAEEVVVKKKRGRPPLPKKVVKYVSESEESESDTVESEYDSESEEEEVIIVPKKRSVPATKQQKPQASRVAPQVAPQYVIHF